MKYFLLLVSLITFNHAICQTHPIASGFENALKQKLDSVKYLTNDSLKLIRMDQIRNELAVFLSDPSTYAYPFDSIITIGKVNSPDNEFRILSWNMFINNEMYRNFAIIQMRPEEGKCQVISLYDNSEIDEIGNSSLRNKNWYGALYYKIIPVKFGRKNYYTVFGLDPYSPFISKKVIDVIQFHDNDVVFGAPVFKMKENNLSRMVFSYSARISMMLNYDESIQTIVFDHLSPSESRYTGQYEFYGPDFSFDGFQLTKDHWLYVEDVKPNQPVRKKRK
jgi:hypothetical protein